MNRKLKAKIIEHYGSQWHFAQAVKERESIVSRVIHGKRNLTDKKQAAWCRALKAETEELFPGNG